MQTKHSFFKLPKTIFQLLIASFIGGLIAVGIYHFTIAKKNAYTIYQSAAPATYAGYTPTIKPDPITNLDFTKAAEKSVNAVVHVQTLSTVTTSRSINPFFDMFFGESRRFKVPRAGSGSGVIISPNGYIVTNNHVIAKADKIQVTLNNKRSYKATVVGADPNTDIAVIKIDAKNLPTIMFGNSANINVGEWVLAVGNPFNLTSTVTAGIVSAKGRSINIIAEKYSVENFIQTDAVVNPGNSGGALVNLQGQLIGINTAIKTHTGVFEGYSFAVPSNLVKKVAMDLIEFGRVKRAILGVSIRKINAAFADEKNIGLKGIWVAKVFEKSAAAEAGIKSGDVIIAINDQKINSVAMLQQKIALYRPGDKVVVSINRNGNILHKTVKLESRKDLTETVKPQGRIETILGATFEQPSKATLQKLNITYGVQVREVFGGKLKAVGVKPGFVITNVNGSKVDNKEDLIETLAETDGRFYIGGYYPNGQQVYYSFG